MDDQEEETIIENLRRSVLIAILLGTVFSVGLGGIIARRGMQPLREIAEAAETFTVGHLNRRLDPSRWPREVEALAAALNNMLDRLEDSFLRMSQFAANIAHELRTPLYNMMGEAEVALSANRSPEEYRSILESSLEEFGQLTRMINEMLFLARADNPRQQIKRERLDAREEMEAVKEFFDALTESRSITVTAHGQGIIEADPLLFRRAVTNLVSNALRHTPTEGRIMLSVEQADERTVVVKVADSGSGIQSEHLRRICDRLFSRDGNNSLVSERTGLGLLIVKSIVELHGGSMEIDSAPLKGTTVVMIFPITKAVNA